MESTIQVNRQEIVDHPINKLWRIGKNLVPATFVGSHEEKNTHEPGFLLPNIYHSKVPKLAVKLADENTPPQPLKHLVSRSKTQEYACSIAPWFGPHSNSNFDGLIGVGINRPREQMLKLREHLGDIVYEPGKLNDDLSFGFRSPRRIGCTHNGKTGTTT